MSRPGRRWRGVMELPLCHLCGTPFKVVPTGGGPADAVLECCDYSLIIENEAEARAVIKALRRYWDEAEPTE